MLHTDAILLFTPPSTKFGRSSGRFLHKNMRSSRWRILSSPTRTNLQGSQMDPLGHIRQWWYHITGPHPEEDVRTPEGRMLPRWHPKAPLCFLPMIRLKKRVSRDERDMLQPGMKTTDMKDGNRIKSPLLLPRTTPIPTSSSIRKKKIS